MARPLRCGPHPMWVALDEHNEAGRKHGEVVHAVPAGAHWMRDHMTLEQKLRSHILLSHELDFATKIELNTFVECRDIDGLIHRAHAWRPTGCTMGGWLLELITHAKVLNTHKQTLARVMQDPNMDTRSLVPDYFAEEAATQKLAGTSR